MAEAKRTAGGAKGGASHHAGSAPASLDDARLDIRFGGYCVLCDRMVVRDADGSCPVEGHPVEGVHGRLVLVDGEQLEQLPRFNVAAFALPFIWGPAHEQWAGALFLPIWLFMDSIIGTAEKGGVPQTIGAIIVVVLTLAFQAFFAKRANGVAYRRVIDTMSIAEFRRRQRRWAWGAVPAALVLAAWMLWFRIVIAPTLPKQ